MRDAARIFPIDTLQDPRIAPYANLKDREVAARGGLFIAEGYYTVTRLIQSGFETVSVLALESRVEEIEPALPPGVPIYVAQKQLVESILGFKFHGGLIAVGRRQVGQTLDDLMRKVKANQERNPNAPRGTVLVCPDVNNVENVGSIIRIGAAFGVDAVMFGERACDPFWRRSIRVSMGTAFYVPVYQSPHILQDLATLKQTHGYRLVGTVLDPDATPLRDAKRHPRTALIFGSEAHGLGPEERKLLDERVTIRMHHGTDSLNIAVSAAVFLHHYGG